MIFASARLRPLRRTWLWILGAGLLLAQAAANSQAQTIAFTFDDGFDLVQDGAQATKDNAAMLAALNQYHVRGMLFPSGPALDNAKNLALVRAWGESKHAIGNHTHDHASLSKTDTELYFADIERAQAILQSLPGWCPRLRFPYLDEGSTKTQHNQAMQWLAQHGYGVAAATIALPDWEFAQQYLNTLQSGSKSEAAAFRQNYLQQIWVKVQAEDAHWIRTLKRSPQHVLLLHTNHLNAAVLPDLLRLLKNNGWGFTDPLSAFKDPIYQRTYANTTDGAAATLPNPVCQ